MVKRIEKEQITGVQFAPSGLHSDSDFRTFRDYLLNKAHQLGNLGKHKVQIQFQTTDGPMEVHTTVWDVTQDMVGLKQGVAIPISSILNITI